MKRNDLCIQWSFGKKKEVAHDNDCRAVARQLIAMHSQPTFVYIYIYMSVTLWAPGGPPGFKMASLTVLWTPFSKL